MYALQSLITVAYQRAVSDPDEPHIKQAWADLARHSAHWAIKVQRRINVELVDEEEPYPDAVYLVRDIKRGYLRVSAANCAHPLWDPSTNVKFRMVHDYFGHYGAFQANDAFDFGWLGESAVCRHHEHLIEPNLSNMRRALLTECLGQVAGLMANPRGHTQKVAFLDNNSR